MVDIVNEIVDHKEKEPAILGVIKKVVATNRGKVTSEPKPWRCFQTLIQTLNSRH